MKRTDKNKKSKQTKSSSKQNPSKMREIDKQNMIMALKDAYNE